VLDAFAIADLVVFAGGSAVTVLAVARQTGWAPLAASATAGGAAYATIWLIGWVLLGGHGWIGVPPMVAATSATTAVAVAISRRR
jgi:hypothetical protein